MELAEVIKGRRSVRRFTPDQIPKEVLEHLLNIAIWAPSAMNRQEWYFIVIQGAKVEEMKKIFADAFEDIKPRLEKVFADKPKIIAATKEFLKPTAERLFLSSHIAGRRLMGRLGTQTAPPLPSRTCNWQSMKPV